MENATQPPLFRALAAVRAPQLMPAFLIDQCRTAGEAVMLSMRLGNTCAKRAAAALGWKSTSTLTEVITGTKNFPIARGAQFAAVTGNCLVQQWFARQIGMQLVAAEESGADRAARVEAENAALRARLAQQVAA